MDIKQEEKERKKNKVFLSVRSEARRLVKRNDRRRRRTKRRVVYDSYMIRVGSIVGCCDEVEFAVGAREVIAASNDAVGVLNGDCLLHKSGVVSSMT